MKIQRFLLAQIKGALLPGKVLILYGPRQVGKTTLANDLLASIQMRSRFVNAVFAATGKRIRHIPIRPSLIDITNAFYLRVDLDHCHSYHYRG